MAGTRWAAQVAFAVGVLLLLAPAALWVGVLGPFYRRHHPLPAAARRQRVEARLVGAAASRRQPHAVAIPPLGRPLELALLTETPAVERDGGSGGVPTNIVNSDVCEWDWPWLQKALAPALAQLLPITRLHPLTSRLVPPAPLLPPGLLPPGGGDSWHAIPTSALGTWSGHLDEAVLGPPFVVSGTKPPLRLVVACPGGNRGRGGLAASFVEDRGSSSSSNGGGGEKESTAVTIDGWGGVLLLPPASVAFAEEGGRARLSEAAHVEVAGFVVDVLRRWVLGEEAEVVDAKEEEEEEMPARLLPLTEAERRALVVHATEARAREALRRLRVLQEEVVGRERPWLTPVPGGVARNFAHALTSLERLADATNGTASSSSQAHEDEGALLLSRLHHASAALGAARAAEADPGLLAPPHLPCEHYAATLLPMLLPVLLPLLVGLVKERRRLGEKRAKKA